MLQYWIRSLTTIGLCAMLTSAAAQANLLADDSFESGIDPLPLLGPVVGPPFSPGFWGAELGGEVTAEFGVSPAAGQYMLYMENEGLAVTQAFQAVDVNSFAGLIDSGSAVAYLTAYYNSPGGVAGPTTVPGLLFFAGANDWGSPLGSGFGSFSLDASPDTWEPYLFTASVPVGTRWIVAQLGYDDSTLPAGVRGYVDVASLRIIPEPATLALLVPALLGALRRR